LENGLKVYYYHNPELPLMEGKMYFRGGSLYDQSGIAGLSSATGSQMRAGSIKGMSPAELDKKLSDMAASIESSFGDEFGTVGFFSLSEDFEEVFSIFSKVIRQPSFNQKRLDLWKALSKEGISQRRDNPSTMASMAFQEQVFGAGTAFTNFKSVASINKINRSRLQQFHSQFVRPDTAYLSISGSLTKAQAKAAVEKYFGDWKAGTKPLPPMPKVTHKIKPGIYVLERDFEQATVIMGHLGPSRHTDDAYATTILNRVFGHGGFSSQLFREIRSRLGLAYTVYGGIWPGAVAGTFQVSMGTRKEKTGDAIEAVLKEIEKIQSELVAEDDFNAARSATEKSFVFKFADPSFVADRAVLLEIMGYPKKYDERYLENIEKVGRRDAQEVAQKRIRPDELAIVVVGSVSAEEMAKKFDEEFDIYRLSFDTKPKVVEKFQ
jgi:zinc protease